MMHRSRMLHESRVFNVWLWLKEAFIKEDAKVNATQKNFSHNRELFNRSRQLGSRRIEPLMYNAVNTTLSSKVNNKRKLNSSKESIDPYATKSTASNSEWMEFDEGLKKLKAYYYDIIKCTFTTSVLVLMLLISFITLFFGYQQYYKSRVLNGLIGPKRRKYASRLTIVLDVDETIVSYGDKAFRLHAGVQPRPYLAELLDYLSEIDAEVILWGACSTRYLKQVLSVIDPNGTRVCDFIARDSSWFINNYYYEKNVCWLNRSLDDTLMIENRALNARSCNENTILVEDFIRGEYMEDKQDYPANDKALLIVRNVIEDLEKTGMPVPEYLASEQKRNPEIHAIPCHLAIRQLPEEIARGVFYFVGNKYKSSAADKETKQFYADETFAEEQQVSTP